MNKKSVVLLSGGMDSTTALAMAAAESSEVIAVSVLYGSKHSKQEMRAAAMVVEALHVKEHIKVVMPTGIFTGSGSALLGESEIPNEEYHDPTKETPSVTVVPYRNANLISIAGSIAEAHGAQEVWVATHLTDHLGWAYPDCSPEFIGAMSAALYIGTMHKVRLVAPFIWMTKSDIVTKAAKLRTPLNLTWSCYRGEDLSCGACPTCIERLKAFADAGYQDPIIYQDGTPYSIFGNGLKEFPYGY